MPAINPIMRRMTPKVIMMYLLCDRDY